MTHKTEKQQLWIILLIVFFGFLGSSVAYPLFPPLFLHPGNHPIVSPAWGASARNVFLGLALAAYPFGLFVGSPILGGCSDRYGRKKILAFSLSGCALGYLLTGLALEFNWLWLLLLSRLLTGFMEGNFSIVRAMATDLHNISKYKSLGRINSVSAIGYVMGPLLGGFFSDSTIVPWFSFSFPFFIAMLFSVFSVVLTIIKLSDTQTMTPTSEITVWQRFNLVGRFRYIFNTNASLKNLLVLSTVFTLSVDIFYEFGPVFLTGLWTMNPAMIAIYNTALSISLVIGSAWLPYLLSLRFPINKVILVSTLLTGIFFGMMALVSSSLIVFFLFAAVGLGIATANTNMTIQISNVADTSIQGEVMGTQLGLRMLGDAIICLAGGFLIIYSVVLPIIISSIIAFLACGLCALSWRHQAANNRFAA